MALTWDQVRQSIAGYRHLPANWDSYGGAAPVAAEIDAALGATRHLEAVGFPPPDEVALGSDGAPALTWQRDPHGVEVYLRGGNLSGEVFGAD